MKFIFLMMVVLSSVSFANLTARSGIKLEKSEPYHAFLYHNSFIFVGASRSTETNQNRVEIYDSEASRKLASLDLPHTCERIFPYTADSVLIVGRENYQLRYGYYSIVSTAGKKFKLSSKIIPNDYFPEFFAGDKSQMYFNSMGDAGVFNLKGNSTRMLAPKLSGPGRIVTTGKYLYVIERRNIMLTGDERLTRIDLATESTSAVFAGNRNFLSNLEWLSDVNLLAVTETDNNELHFVNPDTNQVVTTLPLNLPEGLARMGKCLVVSGRESKELTFVHLGGKTPTVVATWDVAAVAPTMYNSRYIGADSVTGKVYVRAFDLCPSCVSTRNEVYVVEEASQKTLKACSTDFP